MPSISKPSLKKTPSASSKKKIPAEVVNAFEQFEEAKRALLLYIQNNQRAVDIYEQHRQAYNNALLLVQQLYKQHHEVLGASYGGFTLKKKREVDAELLLKLVPGIREFLEYEYKINVGIVEQLHAEGALDDDTMEQIITEKPNSVLGAPKL